MAEIPGEHVSRPIFKLSPHDCRIRYRNLDVSILLEGKRIYRFGRRRKFGGRLNGTDHIFDRRLRERDLILFGNRALIQIKHGFNPLMHLRNFSTYSVQSPTNLFTQNFRKVPRGISENSGQERCLHHVLFHEIGD